MHTSLRLSIPLLLSVSISILALPLSDRDGHQDDKPLVRTLYEYPLGTWTENIAVRPSGELLLTLLSSSGLEQFDPFDSNATPKRVHTFSDTSGLSGIAEIAPDSFAFAAGNFSFTSGGERGSWSIKNVDFQSPHSIEAEVKTIANVPQALFLNGLCNLPSSKVPDDILVGDIDEGVIRRVDTTTGKVSVAVQNKFTAAAPDSVFGGSTGVDGIHVKDGTLYLANVAKQFFASIPVHTDGTPAGEATIISQIHKPEGIKYYDDFTIKGEDAYIVTGSGNSIERIGVDGTPKGRIIAGSLNSTQFAGPTSAAFGRTAKDSHILYVVTSGGLAAPVDGNITVGAQVLAVDTKRWQY